LAVPVYNASGFLTGLRVYQSGTGASTPFVEIVNGTNLTNLTFSACAQKTT